MAIARSYSHSEPDDLLQEILLQLWRSLPRFHRRSSIDTWAYRIALNTAISWRRTRSRRDEKIPQSGLAIEEVAKDAADQNIDHLLERLLTTLSDTDRAVLVMYLDDFTSEATAEALGLSAGSIRVRLHRLKVRLTNWLEGDV